MLSISDLPALNAALNATSGVLLALGYRFIRRRRIDAHRACMLSAFVVSIVFLVSYLVYHAHVGSVRFPGTGVVRVVYFGILITHTMLAACVPPLAILTIARAWRGQFPRHRRIARWTFPVWFYVSVTGVVIYVMLYQIYGAQPLPPGSAALGG